MFQEQLKHQQENTHRSHMHQHVNMLSDEPSLSQSTLAQVSHRDQTYLVHTAGRCMDHLVIRNPSYFKPHNELEEPGFTLSLGQGSKLIETLSIGTSAWQSSSHLLSRTSTELFHVRTVNLSDHVPGDDFALRRENQQWNQNKHKLSDDFCLLEPLQKWTLPCEIVHLAASPNNMLSYAVALSDTGRLYHWTPCRGFGTTMSCGSGSGVARRTTQPSQYKDISCIAANKQEDVKSNNSDSAQHQAQKEMWRLFSNLECSTHPMLCHVSYRKDFYTVDFRTKQSATSLSPSTSSKHPNQLFTTPFLISSIRQSPDNQHNVYVCSKGSVSAIDLRYPKIPVCQRHVPDAHGITKIVKSDMFPSNDNTAGYNHVAGGGGGGDILVGSSKHSSQAFIHSIERPGRLNQQQHSSSSFYSKRNNYGVVSNTATTAYNNRAGASLFYGSGLVHSSQSVFWDTHAYPVVDHRAGGQGVHLCGLELVPCKTKSMSTSGVRDNDDNDNNNNNSDDDEDDEGNIKKRVRFKSQERGKNNNKHTKNNNDQDDDDKLRSMRSNNTRVQYNALLLQQNSLGDVFAQPVFIGMTEVSTGSISRNSHSAGDDEMIVKRSNGKNNNDNNNSKINLNTSAYNSNTVTTTPAANTTLTTAIQWNAPIGVLCPSTASSTVNTPLEFIKKKKSFSGPFCGTSLGLHLSKFDKMLHTYPVSSAVFLPYVDRSSIRPFDILTIDPSRLYIERTLSIGSSIKAVMASGDVGSRISGGGTINNDSLSSGISKSLMPRILKLLYEYPHTLWELWRALNLHMQVPHELQQQQNQQQQQYDYFHKNPDRLQFFRQLICNDVRIVESVDNSMIRFKRPTRNNSVSQDGSATVKKKGRGRKLKVRDNDINANNNNTTTYFASVRLAAAMIDNQHTFDGLYVEYEDNAVDRKSCQCATGSTLCSTDYVGPCRYPSCVLPHVLLYTLHPDYIQSHTHSSPQSLLSSSAPPQSSSSSSLITAPTSDAASVNNTAVTKKRHRKRRKAVIATIKPKPKPIYNPSILNPPPIRSLDELRMVQEQQSAVSLRPSQSQLSQSQSVQQQKRQSENDGDGDDDVGSLNKFILSQSQTSLINQPPSSNSNNNLINNNSIQKDDDEGDEQSTAEETVTSTSANNNNNKNNNSNNNKIIIKKKRKGIHAYVAQQREYDESEYSGDDGGGYSSSYSQQTAVTSSSAGVDAIGGYESTGTMQSSIYTSHSHSQRSGGGHHRRNNRTAGQLVTPELITKLMKSWVIDDNDDDGSC